MKRYPLGKEEKVLKSSEYRKVLRDGKGINTEHFRIVICHNHLEKRRLGITVSRKIGAAVKRNRTKRLLREFFRLHRDCLPPSSDILFIAKTGADGLDFKEVQDELKNILCSDR